jgi:hypothetical protein
MSRGDLRFVLHREQRKDNQKPPDLRAGDKEELQTFQNLKTVNTIIWALLEREDRKKGDV